MTLGISNLNIFADLPTDASREEIVELLVADGVRIERIVSTGQSSPDGFWYDQPQAEWVLVLAGAAGLLIEGETQPRELRKGDHLHLPARCRHRVEWTAAEEPTIWLAVHFGAGLPR